MRNFSRGQFCQSSMGITPRYPKCHLQPQNPQRPVNPNNQVTLPSQIRSPNATRATTSRRSTWEGRGLSSPIFPQGGGKKQRLIFPTLTPQGRLSRTVWAGPVPSFQNHSAARRPPLSTLRRSETTGAFMREDVLETKYGTRPNRPVGSEYPCCYSALPTELRLVMRILTSSVISRIPSLAGFLGSKQAGFSAM